MVDFLKAREISMDHLPKRKKTKKLKTELKRRVAHVTHKMQCCSEGKYQQ